MANLLILKCTAKQAKLFRPDRNGGSGHDQAKSVYGRTGQKEVRNRSGWDEIRLGEGLIMSVASQFTGRKNQGLGREQARSRAGQVRGCITFISSDNF